MFLPSKICMIADSPTPTSSFWGLLSPSKFYKFPASKFYKFLPHPQFSESLPGSCNSLIAHPLSCFCVFAEAVPTSGMLSASFLLMKILLLPEDPSQILSLPQTPPFVPQPVLPQYLHLILPWSRVVHMSVFTWQWQWQLSKAMTCGLRWHSSLRAGTLCYLLFVHSWWPGM